MSRSSHNSSRLIIALTVLLLCAQCAWCASTGDIKDGRRDATTPRLSPVTTGAVSTAAPSTAAMPDFMATYRLNSGDMVQVVVYGEPTLTGQYPIGPAGTIAMPMAGQIPIVGLTLREAEKALIKRLGVIVRSPAVTVTFNEVASIRKVYLAGEFSRTGSMTLPFGATLTDALAAGGPGPFADLRRVRLTHPGKEPVEADCSGLRGEGPLGTQYRLEYGDIVTLLRVKDEVTVVGDVQAPGTVLLPVGQEWTVLDVIRLAQGVPQLVERSKVTLVRKGADPVVIDMRDVLHEGKSEQNRLVKAGDMLIVDRTAGGDALLLGALGRTGPVNVDQVDSPTLLRMVSMAGYGPLSDISQVTLYRNGEKTLHDLRAMLDSGDMSRNIEVVAGDILMVPELEQSVVVTGPLTRGGVVRLMNDELRDLVRLIMQLGPLPAADLEHIVVYRGDQRFEKNLKAYTDNGDRSQTMQLQAGDIISVPSAYMNAVLVSGAVMRPGFAPINDEPMKDLAHLVTMIGTLPNADLSKVTVRRGGQTVVYNLAAYFATGAKEHTVRLEEGDVVEIARGDANVMITGSVARAGLLPLYDEKQRLLSVVLPLVGMLPTADIGQVTVFRGDEVIVRNLRLFYEEGDRAQDLLLMDGDIIRIPEYTDRILLAGALQVTGLIPLGHGDFRDLVKVIMAAGPLQWANIHRVSIHRKGEVITRDVGAYILKGDKSQTMDLQDGDVVVVPVDNDTALFTGALTRVGPLSVANPDQRDLAKLLTTVGPLFSADLSRVAVWRNDVETVYDFSGMRESGRTLPSVDVLPGDRVFIPGAVPTSVLISGALTKQGQADLLTPAQHDLATLVLSNGPLSNADLTRVMVFRGKEAFQFNLKSYMESGDDSQTMQLQSGDRIVVPEQAGNGVLIYGQVMRQGMLPNTVGQARDLLSAVTLASPITGMADLRNVIVYRNGERIVRDLKRLQELGDLSQNLILELGDMVYVPQSAETVIVTGHVQRPGAVNLTSLGNRDVANVLGTASPLATGDWDRIILSRNGERQVINYRSLMENGDTSQNIMLQPGDILFVPAGTQNEAMVLGALTRNGPFNVARESERDLLRIITIMQPLPNADLSRVTIYRENEDPIIRNIYNLQELGDLSQNFNVLPGDVVVVPRMGDIYVLGAVGKPGALPCQPGWTIMDALAAAGWGAGGSGNVQLIRKRPDGSFENIKIDMDGIAKGNPPDPTRVKPGDIIWVSKERGGFSWNSIRDAMWVVGAILAFF